MESSQDWENSKIELYRLFKKLADATGDERRETAGAIIVHDVLMRSLRLACGRVFKSSSSHVDSRDDLLQETNYLLLSAMIRGRIKYHEQGFRPFMAWLREVIDHAAIDAFRGSHPKSLDHFFHMGTEELDKLDLQIETRMTLDDLMIVIGRLKTAKTRRVMRNCGMGMSLAQCAQEIGLTISTVCRIRQRGLDELRRELSAD